MYFAISDAIPLAYVNLPNLLRDLRYFRDNADDEEGARLLESVFSFPDVLERPISDERYSPAIDTRRRAATRDHGISRDDNVRKQLSAHLFTIFSKILQIVMLILRFFSVFLKDKMRKRIILSHFII